MIIPILLEPRLFILQLLIIEYVNSHDVYPINNPKIPNKNSQSNISL